MSDFNINGSKFPEYDTMTDEQLRRILRDDAEDRQTEPMDLERILYVTELLANRRKERGEGRNPRAALKTFQACYCPDRDQPAPSPAGKRKTGAWARRLIGAAAALAVAVGCTAVAGALKSDVGEIVAKWTGSIFYFTGGCASEPTWEPYEGDTRSFGSLQEALELYGITEKLVPTWIPEGYELLDVKVMESSLQRLFYAAYQQGDQLIKLSVSDYLYSAPSYREKSGDEVQIYQSAGVDYYLFRNNDRLTAAWISGGFECSISGPVSVEEMKRMIDSIPAQ